MAERTGELTFKGNPLTLIGPKLGPGDAAPDFTLIANDLSRVSLGDSAGKVRFLSVVPSLDTGVCDIQTREFNKELANAGDAVAAYTISADLPFAQARWCSEAKADSFAFLSDHFDLSFGAAYGVHIKELRLDSRSVFIIDGEGKIVHAEYVPEVTEQPDYEAALQALKSALEA